ncbi:MAG: nodulation protein NfeD [Chitinophagales bacterium]|nr:nodulation protein NfeD [Chitinophagales bacterium]
MRIKLFTILFTLYCSMHSLPVGNARAAEPVKKVYVFELNQEIFPAAWRLVKSAMDEAHRQNCEYVLIKLNTYGGALDMADSIRARLLNAKPTVIVWITQNAASAGALISLSCDSIYMSKGATIGAASVVNQNGEVMPDKYQSYMRGMMRSTAEQQNRDPRIAEGMVTPNNSLGGVADSGRIITLTASEAVKYNYCDGIAESTEEVLKQAHVDGYELIQHEESWLDRFISILLNPVVNGILLLIILGGLYFEFQHPGIGFPIIAAATAAILYFAPLYLDGLAEHWEILIFIIGLILIAIEIFVTPGFGVPGISGITLLITGLTLALIRNVNFDFSFTNPTQMLIALLRVILPLGTAFLLFIVFGKNLFNSRAMRGFVLSDTQAATLSYHDTRAQLNALVNQTGIAITVLRPAGQVEIASERYDAMAEGGMIVSGEAIRVVDVSGNTLVVRKVS